MNDETRDAFRTANLAGRLIAPLIGFLVIIQARPGGAEGVGLLLLALFGAALMLLAWVIPVRIITGE